MSFLSDNIFDSGLDYLSTYGDDVYICNAEPTTITEAVETYALGYKFNATFGAAQNGDVDGRKVTISAIADGVVTATDTATHFAATRDDSGLEELLVVQALNASQGVTNGNVFTLTAFDVTLRDPT